MDAVLKESAFSEELYLLPEQVTIVIEKPWSEVTPAEQIQFSKILGALKLNLDKVRILVQTEFTMNHLIGSPTHVIVFGLVINGISLYDSLTIQDVKVVFSESLSVLVKNEESKKKLWLSLKSMFGL